MKRTLTSWPGLAMAATLALAAGGCGNNQANTPDVQLPSANQIGKSMETAANTVKKEAGPAMAKVENAAKKVEKEAGPALAKGVKAVETTTAPAVHSAEEMAMTAKVKGAIMADRSVDSSTINVDVKKNEVILRGRVKTAKEKTLLQEIAHKQAMNYKIVNQLQVVGAAKQ